MSRLDRRQLEREMDDEMELHIELHAEALERQGVPPADARRRARAEFGGVQQYREQGREARAFSLVHDLVADLRYGARALRRSPGFTLVAVLSLALGFGATTTIFGVVYGTMLQTLPLPHPAELSALALMYEDGPATRFRRQDILALRRVPGAPRLEAVDEANDVRVDADNIGGYQPIDYVDGGYFDLLGIRPALGRVISTDDDRAGEHVVVISDAVWSRFFARDPSVIGKAMTIAGQHFTVIGVLPRSYHGIEFNSRLGLAVPESTAPALGMPESRQGFLVLTRTDAASRPALSALLDAALHRCCLTGSRNRASIRLSVIDASRGVPGGKGDFRDDYRLVLWLLLGGVLVVLLVACSNVGNLLLARGAARERELAVRLSIGASRARVVRQLLAESLLLAALGGLAGWVLAAWATSLLVAAVPSGEATAAAMVEFHAKPAVIGFAAVVSIACVVLFGLGPAMRATRGDLVSSLKDRARTRAFGREIAIDRLLVVGQVAGTLVLVCGGGLLVATVRNLRTIDPGFVSDHLIMAGVETRATPFEQGGIIPIYQEVLERVRRVPGVKSVAMATRIPAFGGRNTSLVYSVVGQAPPQDSSLDITVVTPGYFTTAGTRLIGGRDFDSGDTPAVPRVGIVNDAFARKHFLNRSPIGAQLRVGGGNEDMVTIVGVVQDVRFGDRRTRQDPMLYLPASQAGHWPFLELMVRSPEPRSLVVPIERAISSYSPSLRVQRWQTMDEAFDEVILRERFAAGISATCALLALGLAMVGLSGIVGFSVARRTREIGVRIALGARRSTVVWLVLRGAIGMVGVGIIIGVPLAIVAARALGALLVGIGAANPFVLAGAATGLVLVAVLASATPAWRASRVDPVTSLRAD
jgi:predicted permease